MLRVNVVERLEGVAGVVAAPEGALVADALAARPAVHAQLLLVQLALVEAGFAVPATRGPNLLTTN